MNYRYTAAIGILIAGMIGGSMVLANVKDGYKHSAVADRQHLDNESHGNPDKKEHGDHDGNSETHDDRDPITENDSHGKKHDEDGHGEHDQGEHSNQGGKNEPHSDMEHASHAETRGEGDDGHGDEEESDIIEMTRAQQKETGLIIHAARSGDIENILSFTGEVRLNQDQVAHLVPLVSGIVRGVSASLGDTVREGQTLAWIDSPELAELKADYFQKTCNLELTRRTFERKDYLKKENIASEADWLEAQASFQTAETALLEARRRLTVLGLSKQDILGISGATDDSFGRFSITAPISGTIIARHITRGEKIDGEELFTIADLSTVWVDLQIPAKDIWKVKKGVMVEITSTEGKVAQGELSLVGPVVNEASRTALGRIFLNNPEDYWIPGLFVKGQILDTTTSSAVVVPSEAVQNIDGKDVVFVPEGDGFKPVEITLGKSNREKIQILAGLNHGEHYVAKGAFALKALAVTSGAGGHAGHGH